MKCVFCLLFIILAILTGIEITHASSMVLSWKPSLSPDAAGYNVYYGTTSGNYPYKINAGNVATITISGLTAGAAYYFAARAYNAEGSESVLSSPIRVIIPDLPVVIQPVVPDTNRISSATTTTTRVASLPPAQSANKLNNDGEIKTTPFSLAMTLIAKPHGPALLQFPVEAGHRYEVQATTDFRHWRPIWQSRLAAAKGSMQFADPDSKSFASRFYRLVLH